MTRREIPLDGRAILAALAEHEVQFVVIGGLAVQAHGHPRTTQDLDIVPEPSAENLRRLEAALEDLRGRPVGEPPRAADEDSEPIRIPASGVLALDTDAGGIDVHLDPPGAPRYDALRARALELRLEHEVAVAGLDDLIAMKRASNRPIDRSDILTLTSPE